MITITIKEFSRNPSKFLKELPFLISNRGVVVAEVRTPQEISGIEVRTKQIERDMRNSATEMCTKHEGSMKMTCGCT